MRRGALLLFTMAMLLLEAASCGGSGSRPPVTVTVAASPNSVPVDGTSFLTATVLNSSDQSVTWSVVGGAANGSISSTGVYTAPATVPANPQVTVTATPQANPLTSGQASITITISVAVTPASAIVQTLRISTFTASVQGSSNQSVTWEVNGIAGGNNSVGTINGSGVYQAPESVPANASSGQTINVTIEAVPQANPSLSASATVTVTSPNQLGQNLPIKLGTSGSNINDEDAAECAGGTLGSLVVRAGIQYILSDNHILARSDAAALGEGIIQPGLIDTPSPCSASSGSSVVAHLSQFINIEQTNPPADAAIAQVVTSPASVDSSGTIIELGDSAPNGVPTDEPPASTILPVSSLVPNSTAVAKSGRSTGLTCSTIEAVNIDASVQYQRGLGGASFTAIYHNQISVNGGTFSAAGDSGSLIVSQAGAQPVALLYAGSSTDTIGAPVATVLANLADANKNTPTFVGPATRGPVAGCTSAGADALGAASQANPTKPTAAEIAKAEAVKNQKAPQLLSDPSVLAIGVGRSLDRPNHAAIVVFVQKGQPLVRPVPHTVGGVLTRVVAAPSLNKSGVLDQQSTAELLKKSGLPERANPTPEQFASATSVKDKYSSSMVHQPGILGVGVTSSLDNPSDAAIIVYVETGKSHSPIPLELDGVRVRVKYTDKFRAYSWGRRL
ncbi:MAG TPA: hypothetical protein VGR93_11805 [Candidatus Acidoferrales bacterium]|nr:hypothetical protein [Candidatus Acidoferrales bacterium]